MALLQWHNVYKLGEDELPDPPPRGGLKSYLKFWAKYGYYQAFLPCCLCVCNQGAYAGSLASRSISFN